jgi:cytochrome c-type biogenesis protein CcmH
VSELAFWLVAAAMLAAMLGRLLWPLLRRDSRPPPTAASYDVAVYVDQLAELERETARGVIGEVEAAAARLEIERRLLAAGRPAATARRPVTGPRTALVAGLAIVLTAAALGLYLELGAPGMESQPFAQRAQPGSDTQDLASATDQLARRLSDNPADPQGWMLLGRSYGELGRFADSAAAYRAAVDRKPDLPGLQSAYGEALILAAAGAVTEPARQAFAAALKQDPGDPRARFYLAMADAQAGRADQALDQLVKLEAEGPADAPWLPMVTSQIDRLARAAGKDPATLPGRRPPTSPPAAGTAPPLDPETMAAAQAMTPEQRAAFVRSMVDRLAERLKQQPGDLAGWVRLAKAYGVLQRDDQARDAWRHAAALAPDDSGVQLGYAEALLATGGTPPPEFAATVTKVLAREPENRLALYYAGVAAATAGHADEARRHWQHLLALMPADAPQRAAVQRQIDGLAAP